MKIARNLAELDTALSELRHAGRRLGFVPTMGALHQGHLFLVKKTRESADDVAVSIYVNPTQFGPNEDFRSYPRSPEKDCALLEAEGVDLVFLPATAVMYPKGTTTTVDPGPVGDMFEGKTRPGHLRGVLTIVAKLLNLIQPNVAVFGQKDAQQLFLIRRMAADLNFSVLIIEGETMREEDGLAMSSRNVYLREAERKKARVLSRALSEAGRLIGEGMRGLDEVQSVMREVLGGVPEFEIDYATAVGEADFVEHDPLADESRLIIAGKLGSVRLIDNMQAKKAQLFGTDILRQSLTKQES